MTRAEEAKHHIEDPAAYEHRDVPAKGVLIFIGGLFLGLALVLMGVAWLFGFFTERREMYLPFPLPKANQIPPPPRLEQRPYVDMRVLRAQEDAILGTYGWVDRNAGVVRIPIDRAIDLVAQRGLPARTGSGPVPTVPSTGPESGGPQTGAPVPRGKPAQPATAIESSRPLRGEPQTLPGHAQLPLPPPAAPKPGAGSAPGRDQRTPGTEAPGARGLPQGGGSRSKGPAK